jgi:hypothetical protein
MKLCNLFLPAMTLATAAVLLIPAKPAEGYTTIGGSLDHTRRHFRVFNNFTDPTANSNQTPHVNFPGALGATMAIWKASIEWGTLHGTGTGDPHQPTTLGSGNSNFEVFFAGAANSVGGENANIHSQTSSCGGGTLAFTETPISDGWRIRYCGNWTWYDGPGTNIPGADLQGVACHEVGHALGLGHTSSPGATMQATVSGSGVPQRSIESDDIAGVQFLYGTISAAKPRITAVQIVGSNVLITGQNFSPTNNTVWFTPPTTSGATNFPTLFTGNVSSTDNGTQISVPIHPNAQKGHIAVRRNSTASDSVSNPWPFDPTIIPPCAPQVQNFCVTSPNSVGPGALMSYGGSTSVADNDLVLIAYGVRPNQNGIFFYGPSEISQPLGNGIRCVGGGSLGIFRFPVRQADAFGDLNYVVDFNVPPASQGNGQITPGSLWRFQAWYRDPQGGGATFNLSDGLAITFCP